MARENFTKEKVRIIAERAAYLCSNPECRMITSGPHSDDNKSLKNGIAAHICAASPRGPRYNPSQTSEERSSVSNGIWLCHNCSDLIDKDPVKFSNEILIGWKKTHINFIESERKKNYSDSGENSRGGKGGNVFVFSRYLTGNGSITVDGGDGLQGGDAGNVRIETAKNDFSGDISAKGGKSTAQVKNNKNNDFFEEIYFNTTGAQLRFLEVLRESMRGGGRGMDCGYVSRYFLNIIGSMTNRYNGWITPFITAYIQEKGLTTVSDNFFSLTKTGEEFLEYIKSKGYPIQEKEL